MWQIAWMLGLLPEWFWTLVLIAGILGLIVSFILKFIPFVGTYKTVIQITSILFLTIGVYFQGYFANEEKYKSEHERLQKLIDEAKLQSQKANDDLAAAIRDKDAALSKSGEKIVQRVDRWLKGDVVTIVQNMSPEERAQYEARSKEEKEKFEKKIKELQESNAKCPVPTLVIEGINEAARPPAKGDKK